LSIASAEVSFSGAEDIMWTQLGEKKIAEYVRNQLQEDIAADQISLKEYVDPSTDDKNKNA